MKWQTPGYEDVEEREEKLEKEEVISLLSQRKIKSSGSTLLGLARLFTFLLVLVAN